jgi:Leucine-rich repeat (LRR) protein
LCVLSFSAGVTALTDAISGNGALSKLDASDNIMFGRKDKAGITAWADALKANTSITELNLAKNDINANDTKILAPAISDNEALIELDISNNRIGAEQKRGLQRICVAGGIEPYITR